MYDLIAVTICGDHRIHTFFDANRYKADLTVSLANTQQTLLGVTRRKSGLPVVGLNLIGCFLRKPGLDISQRSAKSIPSITGIPIFY